MPVASALPSSPTYDSNWLVPGHLAIGALPDGPGASALATAGVSTFVSLIGEHTFDQYERGERVAYPTHVTNANFIHFPIRDFDVPDVTALNGLVLELKRRIVAGECVFVHCRGGHGRTGTVTIPLVAALFDLDDAAATAFVNQATNGTRPSDMRYPAHMPETAEQRALTAAVNSRVRLRSR
jgi:hypothetical protein